MSAKKVEALKCVLTGGCVPSPNTSFCSAMSTTQLSSDQIDFARPTTQELEALSRGCELASFGLNNEDVSDEAYRKAGKIDAFAALFDPCTLGIQDIIERDLLASGQAVEFELSKLNVYAKGGFFKPHQDTPRADTMFGSLVVVFPAHHEGGQLALCLDDQKWIVDFADQLAAAAEPSICFVAFFSDVEHEILPVTSGYRATLTYNLHFRAPSNIPHVLSGPFHDRLKEKLIALVNDARTLPKGGYLGIGLCHQYVYNETKPIDSLVDRLKGSDAALANVCKELRLPYSLRLLYAQEEDSWPDFHLLSRVKLDVASDPIRVKGSGMGEEDTYDFMKKYYKDPVPQVLGVKEMSSILCESSYACYGNEVYTDRFYATASMMITVKPMESREALSES